MTRTILGNSHNWVCRWVTGVTEVTCTVNRVTWCKSQVTCISPMCTACVWALECTQGIGLRISSN